MLMVAFLPAHKQVFLCRKNRDNIIISIVGKQVILLPLDLQNGRKDEYN